MSYSPRSLEHVLRAAQQRGTLGDRPIAEVMAHARQFVAALPQDVRRVLDLGTGAGVPGLIVAAELPTVAVVLLDRRENRIDSLRRDVAALGWVDRVTVVCAEAEVACREADLASSFDAVVARGFGPPAATAHAAGLFLRPGGVLVVSEPPASGASRWEPALCARAGFESAEAFPGVVRLRFLGGVSRETSNPG